MAAAGGQLCITQAYRLAPSREISIFDYGQILYAMLLGLLFLSEFPDGLSILGYLLIFAFAGLNYYLNRRDYKSRPRKEIP